LSFAKVHGVQWRMLLPWQVSRANKPLWLILLLCAQHSSASDTVAFLKYLTELDSLSHCPYKPHAFFHSFTQTNTNTMATQEPPQRQGQGQGQIPVRLQLPSGQQPTSEQIQAMQRQLAIDAQKNGMTVPQFVEKLKAQALAQQQAQQQAAQQKAAQQQQTQAQQQHQPINPGPPNPAALAVAKFLKSQDLKTRTCILNGERKDMFKGMLSSPQLIHSYPNTNKNPQSSVPCERSNPRPTQKRAAKMLCSPKSQTAPRWKTPSSYSRSRCSLSAYPKLILTRATTMPQERTRPSE